MIWINLWLGKYHILSILDSLSPNPHVFLASHIKLQEYRVIKKISKTHPFFKQLKKEAKFLSEHSLELIPRLYDIEEDNENLYLVEEYVQGLSLASEDFLRNKLKERELVDIVTKLFDFLKFINSLEESVLYIDWKPANIIITEKGVKIVDFGSVLYSEEDDFTSLATEGFAAPELKKGKKPGSYTDVYGFGSIIKYLTDRTEGEKTLLKRTVKEKLIKLSAKCIRENYRERPDIKALEKAIKSFAGRRDFSFRTDSDRNILNDVNSAKIGICGNTNGVGTTHIAFCVANELIKQGRKVAYVAVDRDMDTELKLCRMPEGLKHIQIYKNVYEEDIAYFLKKGFDNLIIDFGKIDEFSLLFHSCDTKLVVVQNNFVKGGELEEFLTSHQDDIGEKGWMILDNLSDDLQLKETKTLIRKIGLKTACKGMGVKRI